MERGLSCLALAALTSASATMSTLTTSGRSWAAAMSRGVWPRTLLMLTCALHSRSWRTAAGRSCVAATMRALRPSAVCAFTSDLCSSSSSTVVRLPMTPSMMTLFSTWSPAAPGGESGAFAAYISAVQPSLSVAPTAEFRARRCATTAASLPCAAHMSGVLPSPFACSWLALLASSSSTTSMCPLSALSVSGVLPFAAAGSPTSARAAMSLATTSRLPLRQDHVSAVKPSRSLAARSAFCATSQETSWARHCVAATCSGVAPVSSRASRSAR
mmetsp:Transcript_2514/g.7453  ORF Transcript_2514/g.7453 Transcript_2514/m.7453 type:complete len:272 (+) Transcript_2514:124-939(+)